MCAAYDCNLSKPNIPFEQPHLPPSSINLLTIRPNTNESSTLCKRVLKVGKKHFEFGSELARTKLATVFRGVELRLLRDNSLVRTFRYVAIKAVRKDSLSDKTQENILGEISALKELLTVNEKLSNYVESCQDSEHYYLVTRLCEGGDLFSHVNEGHLAPFDENRTKLIFRKLVLSFKELHQLGWAHRDASSENILYSPINNDEVLVIDYGMAIKHTVRSVNADYDNDSKNRNSTQKNKKSYHKIDNSRRRGCGKAFYRSPESFLVPMPDLDFRCDDVWALGVILFLMLTGSLPMKSATVSDDSYCIIAQDKRLAELLALWQFPLSTEAVDLMQSMLVTNPEERPTAEDILSHPWLSSPLSSSSSSSASPAPASASAPSSCSSPTSSLASTEGA